jgi:hypothetical protein
MWLFPESRDSDCKLESDMRFTAWVIVIVVVLLAGLLPACAEAPRELPEEIAIGCAMATSSVPAWGPNIIKAVELAVGEINSQAALTVKAAVEDRG